MSEITLPFQFEPRWYQLNALTDPRRFKVLVLSRQSGKTSLAINALIHAAFQPGNEGKVFHYVFPQKTQAKKAVWDAPNMIRQYIPTELIAKKNDTELKIEFINGSMLYILGADNFDSLRGMRVQGVILDEYAQMKPAVFDEIYMPILTSTKGFCWFIGTPKGTNDFYSKLNFAKNHPDQWQAIEVKASEAGVLSRADLDFARSQMTESNFLQEFEVVFHDGGSGVFRRVRNNIAPTLKEPEIGKSYKMGLDLARHSDWTVITVIDRHTHEMVYMDRFNQIDWNLQKARIESSARRYNNAIITMDSSSMGDVISEDLRRVGLQVNDFVYTNLSKKNLIENLALLIEQGKIRYPDIPEMIAELEAFTYEYMPITRQVRYGAPDGLHDDIVNSLALAYWQVGEKLPALDLRPKNYGFKIKTDNYSKRIF